MKKYIFLDIDGVLNCMSWFEQNKNKSRHTEINPEKVKLLKEIVDRTGAEIILSSSWRILNSSESQEEHDLYSYLLETLRKFGLFITDCTPYVNQNRPQEIKIWMQNNAQKSDTRFVSLDDDYPKEEYDKYGIGDCLIKTSFYAPNGGLNIEHVKKAIEILNGGITI